MSLERRPEQGPDRITFEEIISNAKEVMLRDGQHTPTLIVEGTKNLMAGQIPDMPPTHGERLDYMHFLGQVAAKSGRVDQIQQVFMVSEGWLSPPREDKPADMRPAQDPNRKEVLIISAIQSGERKKRLKMLGILRDSDKRVVGFEEVIPDQEENDESVEVPLLDAFVQGFQTAFRIRFN